MLSSSLLIKSTGTGESATERGAAREPTTTIFSTSASFTPSSAAYEFVVPRAAATAKASVPVRNLIDMNFPSRTEQVFYSFIALYQKIILLITLQHDIELPYL